MKIILVFVLSMLASAARGGVGTEAVAQAYNRFGFELLRQARHAQDGTNLFLSPAGLAFALSMVQNGARGETLTQIAATLHVNDFAQADLNAANKALLDGLTSLDPKLKLEIANGMWTDKNAVVEPEFAAANKSAFNTEVFSADFKDPAFVKTINDWVSGQTDGKISQMIQGPLDPTLRLIVLDAIYFNGAWLEPFDAKATRNLPFTLAGGEVVQQPRMARGGKISYFENDLFQAVELPYAGGNICMDVFLPKGSLDEFFRSFTAAKFEEWTRRMESRRGTLELPRFKLKNEYNLKGILADMGMPLAFTASADFTGISSERLCISWVRQNTYVDVNEEGTEAAAVTGIGVRALAMHVEPPPFRMVVDHPFLVTLRDRKTGLILFLGLILDPR